MRYFLAARKLRARPPAALPKWTRNFKRFSIPLRRAETLHRSTTYPLRCTIKLELRARGRYCLSGQIRRLCSALMSNTFRGRSGRQLHKKSFWETCTEFFLCAGHAPRLGLRRVP